ncbi:hypothetical protein SAMN05414137_14321 [Streptacidiphilus jiangxiensis]|uniref:Uncharacterized protein n=1 Tax=Streptacidiphilus jiangxiensis TaxID=235985 RepID=A0A1H8ACD3_STRJI|nr:hypothetical protein SAMN05414137_14321 [Streptacidiphilus jiangxiensis]
MVVPGTLVIKCRLHPSFDHRVGAGADTRLRAGKAVRCRRAIGSSAADDGVGGSGGHGRHLSLRRFRRTVVPAGFTVLRRN